MSRKTICARASVWLGVALLLTSLAPAAHAQAGSPEKVVEVLGQKIRYLEAGQGPNLIFLHGLGGEASMWGGNMAAASQKYHVYALDQIGFGQSDKPLIDYKIETFVEFLQGFMQALAIPKATLVGNSLGGWIAADFAAQHPQMVDRLVLVDAAGMRRTGDPSALPVDLNPSSLAVMRKIMESVVYNKQAISDALVRQVFEQHLRSGDAYTIQRVMSGIFTSDQFEDAKLGSIKAPTLVLWGREDALIPLSSAERYQKGIAGARLVVIDQCGHIPMMEKPAEFNKALLEFLGQP